MTPYMIGKANPIASLVVSVLSSFMFKPDKGSFKNHVDIILPIFDHPPTSVDTF